MRAYTERNKVAPVVGSVQVELEAEDKSINLDGLQQDSLFLDSKRKNSFPDWLGSGFEKSLKNETSVQASTLAEPESHNTLPPNRIDT